MRYAEYTFAGQVAAGEAGQDEYVYRALREWFPNATDIAKVETDGNDGGVDWRVGLPGNPRPITFDQKHRNPPFARYWRPRRVPLALREPEFALEPWSVRGPAGADEDWWWKVGWTLDPSKQTEYILFTFDPSEHPKVYMRPFQQLRLAFTVYKDVWRKKYRSRIQRTTDGWYSECIYVPKTVVDHASACASTGDYGAA